MWPVQYTELYLHQESTAARSHICLLDLYTLLMTSELP